MDRADTKISLLLTKSIVTHQRDLKINYKMECHSAKREIWVDLKLRYKKVKLSRPEAKTWSREKRNHIERRSYQQISWRTECTQLKGKQGEWAEEIPQNTSQCNFLKMGHCGKSQNFQHLSSRQCKTKEIVRVVIFLNYG